MKKTNLLHKALFATITFVFATNALAQSADSFNFQGELLDSSDVPVDSNNVDLMFSIYNPAGDCLLYQEKQNLDLSLNDGEFSVAIGSAIGSAKRTGTNDPGLSMTNIFRNSGGQIRASSSPQCTPGYNPTATDNRKIQVTILNIDGTAINQNLSLTDINSIPMAALAISYSPTGSWSNNSFRITEVASPSAGTDAVNKTYADTNLKGEAISGSPTVGQVLQYTGSGWTPVAMGGGGTVTSVSAASPFIVTGGTTAAVISLPKSSGGTDGYLSATDWLYFSNKLSNTLSTGMIYVGNGGVATPTTMNGDATLNSAGNLSLNMVTVSKGGTGTTTFAPNKIIGSNGTGTALVDVTCTLNQVLAFDVSGNYTCQNISAIYTPLASGSPGNIQFNTGGALGGATNLFWDQGNSRLGLGTNTPTQQLSIESNSGVPNGIAVKNTIGGSSGVPVVELSSTGGALAKFYQGGLSSTFPGGSMAGGIGTFSADPFAIVSGGVERIRIDPNGNIGIGGMPAPQARIKVNNGSIAGDVNIVPTGSTADFSLGNTVVLQSVGGPTISLTGIVLGGKYTLVIEDPTVRTYSFGGCGTTRFNPANGPTTASLHTVYEIFSTGTNCYIKWSSGY